MVFSQEKARMFTLGCPNLLVTADHQPLISILGDKSLADIPNPRLYRFKEKCLRFRLKIQYLPGGKNDMPDCMSRIYDGEEDNNIDQDDYNEYKSDNEVGAAISACYIDSVEEQYVSRCKEDNQAVTWLEIIQAGEKDAVKKAILEGFPEKLKECIPPIQAYHKSQLNLSIVTQDDLEVTVYYDSYSRSRMLIPRSLRNQVKQILHADHRRDLIRVKRWAQEHVFWPNMTSDLKSFIEQCVHCQVNMPSHPKEPLIPTESPVYPFQRRTSRTR